MDKVSIGQIDFIDKRKNNFGLIYKCINDFFKLTEYETVYFSLKVIRLDQSLYNDKDWVIFDVFKGDRGYYARNVYPYDKAPISMIVNLLSKIDDLEIIKKLGNVLIEQDVKLLRFKFLLQQTYKKG
ncbi:hypothetical protein D4R71_01850 [bacterium]|nr:MAG: hypothetical protein D4R71_01850 [bacterium]